jgi:hypothetical protein
MDIERCLDYWKQWVLRCLPWKKKEKRDNPCSCKYFKFQQERYVSRSKVELR